MLLTEICINEDYGYRIKYLDLDYIQNSEFITMNSSSKPLLKCSSMSDKLAGEELCIVMSRNVVTIESFIFISSKYLKCWHRSVSFGGARVDTIQDTLSSLSS